MNLNDYNWHDQIIKNIIINRESPGKSDIIEFEIEWESGNISTITFLNVYWANLSLNFGIVSPESIYKAFIAKDCDIDLCKFKDTWKNVLNKDIEDFK